MRIPIQIARRPPLRFNITPLIDVVFLLIIFFLVASHFVRNEQSESVTLPQSILGTPDEDAASHRLTITVRNDGQLSIASQEHSSDEIAVKLKELSQRALERQADPEVRIRSDRAARSGAVKRIMEQCAAVNIRRIYFAVETDRSIGSSVRGRTGE